jgi:hypothetical protein
VSHPPCAARGGRASRGGGTPGPSPRARTRGGCRAPVRRGRPLVEHERRPAGACRLRALEEPLALPARQQRSSSAAADWPAGSSAKRAAAAVASREPAGPVTRRPGARRGGHAGDLASAGRPRTGGSARSSATDSSARCRSAISRSCARYVRCTRSMLAASSSSRRSSPAALRRPAARLVERVAEQALRLGAAPRAAAVGLGPRFGEQPVGLGPRLAAQQLRLALGASLVSTRSCCAATSASLSARSRSRKARSCSWKLRAFCSSSCACARASRAPPATCSRNWSTRALSYPRHAVPPRS